MGSKRDRYLLRVQKGLPNVCVTGKVPSLEIKEGEVIYESLVTVEYLDDIYPQRPLLPKDPVKKAFDKIIVESIGPVSR